MNQEINFKEILNVGENELSCRSFLESISKELPFKGVAYVDMPEILPAKVNSKFVFSKGESLDSFQLLLCEGVRKKLIETVWTPENFIIEADKLDNQEIVTLFGVKSIVRVPLYLDCSTICGVLYFAHDEVINSDRYELFALLNSIGVMFSKLYFKEYGNEVSSSYSEVGLLKKMLNTNHDLISSVIHDLSNPLTVIYFETQKSLNNPERDTVKSLTNIETSIDHIYKIIDSTKKFFSKYKDKEDLEVVKIEDVVDFVNFQFAANLVEKELAFESDGLSLEFIAFKSTFLNTVITSLISNSIRYSKEKATIKLYGREVANVVEVVIEDEAGGFPEEVLENLKSNFKSKPTPSTSGDVGSGMGLVIAKSYLQIMNGKLEIEALGNGSRIILKMSK